MHFHWYHDGSRLTILSIRNLCLRIGYFDDRLDWSTSFHIFPRSMFLSPFHRATPLLRHILFVCNATIVSNWVWVDQFLKYKIRRRRRRRERWLIWPCVAYCTGAILLVKSTTAAQVGNLVSRSYETRSLVLLAYYLRIAGHVVGALPTLSDIHRHVFKDQVGGHLYPVSKPNETVCDIICRVCKCIIVSSPSREIRMAPYGSRLPRIRFFFSRLRVKRGNQTRTHCTPSLRIILFINRGIKSDRFYGSLSKSL